MSAKFSHYLYVCVYVRVSGRYAVRCAWRYSRCFALLCKMLSFSCRTCFYAYFITTKQSILRQFEGSPSRLCGHSNILLFICKNAWSIFGRCSPSFKTLCDCQSHVCMRFLCKMKNPCVRNYNK